LNRTFSPAADPWLPGFFVLLLLLGHVPEALAARQEAADPASFRQLVHQRIVDAAAAEAEEAGGPDLAPMIAIEWKRRELGFTLGYERRIDYDSAGRLSLLETWSVPRRHLGTFLRRCGHPDPPDWGLLTGGIEDGFVIASRKERTLVVIRDGDDPAALWALPPYPLEQLPALDPPPAAEKQSGVGRGLAAVGRNLRQLVAEIVIDELTYVRGVPITSAISHTFDFGFGALTPRIRLQRRIRMEDDDTFTVVDAFEGQLNMLLGDPGGRADTGVFLEAKRRVVVFRGGYERWYKALFAPPYDPRKLPWNVEKLQALPPGVRVVFPASTGLFLGENREVMELLDGLPLDEIFKIGLRGTFFLSLSRDEENQLEMRFGGRVERVAFVQFRAGFERRSSFDLRRALGRFIKLRLEHLRGARLFYQRKIDLTDQQQATEAMAAVKRGLRISGYRLGGAAVGDFVFIFSEVDQRTLDAVISKNLPDFQWDNRVESTYVSTNWYGKGDLKLASIGRSHSAMDDTWQLTRLRTGESVSGTSGKLRHKKSARFWVNRDRHDIQVHFLSSRGRDQEQPLTDFIEVFVRRKETRTTRRELRSMLRRTERSLGQEMLDESGFPGILPDRDVYHRMDYRWHLILQDDALDHLADTALAAPFEMPGSLSRKLARRHPYSFRKLRKVAENGTLEERNGRLAHLVLAALRWNEPVHVLFSGFPADAYLFDWSIGASDLPNSGGFCGRCAVPEEMRWAWQIWQELSDFDDLYEDLDLFD